jgi:hypothetical protein
VEERRELVIPGAPFGGAFSRNLRGFGRTLFGFRHLDVFELKIGRALLLPLQLREVFMLIDGAELELLLPELVQHMLDSAQVAAFGHGYSPDRILRY